MPENATLCTVDDYASCTTDFLRNFLENNECDCLLSCDIPEFYHYELSYSAYPVPMVDT